jgi:hypothetical protein
LERVVVLRKRYDELRKELLSVFDTVGRERRWEMIDELASIDEELRVAERRFDA